MFSVSVVHTKSLIGGLLRYRLLLLKCSLDEAVHVTVFSLFLLNEARVSPGCLSKTAGILRATRLFKCFAH